MILTRKIQLYPVGDKEEVNRVYQYIRDGIFNQNKAMNQYMTALYVGFVDMKIMQILMQARILLNRQILESKICLGRF